MKSLEELRAIREKMENKVALRQETDADFRVVVGMATCGIAAGARPVLAAFLEEAGKRRLHNVQVTQAGCIGACRLEPVAEVFSRDGEKVTYVKLTAEKAARIVAEHIVNGRIVTEYTIGANE